MTEFALGAAGAEPEQLAGAVGPSDNTSTRADFVWMTEHELSRPETPARFARLAVSRAWLCCASMAEPAGVTPGQAIAEFDPAAYQAFLHEAERQRQETLQRYPREAWAETDVSSLATSLEVSVLAARWRVFSFGLIDEKPTDADKPEPGAAT